MGAMIAVERIPTEEAKAVICKIIAAAGGELHGMMVLYKAFYKAHLIYFKNTDLELTGYPIVNMPHGPGIDKVLELLDELRAEKKIEFWQGNGTLRSEYGFRAVVPVRLGANPADRAIREGLNWANSFANNDALSHASHGPSWYDSSSGQEQSIHLDLMTREEVKRLKDRIDERSADVMEAFSSSVDRLEQPA